MLELEVREGPLTTRREGRLTRIEVREGPLTRLEVREGPLTTLEVREDPCDDQFPPEMIPANAVSNLSASQFSQPNSSTGTTQAS